MSADVSVVKPDDLRQSSADWLWGSAQSKAQGGLPTAAQLVPLLSELPPPGARKRGLAPLNSAALQAFELKPVAAAPATAASTAPVDMRRRIWELSHQVHDVYTNHWPHTWARPAFALDAQNPTPQEWMPYADVLLKSNGCKATLEKWRDAPETAPRTREALSELIDKLGRYAVRMRKRREAEQKAAQQESQAQRAAQAAQLALQERQLESTALQQRHGAIIAGLQAELQTLQSAKRVDLLAVNQKMMEIAAANTARIQEINALQLRHTQAANAEAATAAPSPSESAGAAGVIQGVADGDAASSRPPAKRPRGR